MHKEYVILIGVAILHSFLKVWVGPYGTLYVPDLSMLAVLYFILYRPYQLPLWLLVLIPSAQDLAGQNLFGLSALLYLLIYLAMIWLRRRISALNFKNLWAVVAGVNMAYALLTEVFLMLWGGSSFLLGQTFINAVITTAFCPIVFFLFSRLLH